MLCSQYRFTNQIVLSLAGDLICVLADHGSAVFSMYHENTVHFEGTPGRRVCVTSAQTLQIIQPEHLAWYMA